MTQRRIKGLGEVALRVHDLDAMQRFYEQVIDLEDLRQFDNAVFSKSLTSHSVWAVRDDRRHKATAQALPHF